MKIVHITTVHSRYDTRIFLNQCISLVSKNHSVHLIVADGLGDESREGVCINDVGRAGSRLSRFIVLTKRAYKVALTINADIYQIHDPELIPVALKLKRNNKVVVFDMHENTDLQILEKKWIPRAIRRVVSVLYKVFENYAITALDAVIVPQPAMLSRLPKGLKARVVSNFPSIASCQQSVQTPSKFRLIYAGGISEARGVFNMLDLMRDLGTINKEYMLTLAGYIDPELMEDLVRHPGWAYVKYLGEISQASLREEYARNSFGLILFNNVGQYFMAYSMKLFEYLNSGLVVIMPDFGDWLGFNQQNNVGFCVDPKDSKRTAEQIDLINFDQLTYYRNQNASLVRHKFHWEKEFLKLLDVYEEVGRKRVL